MDVMGVAAHVHALHIHIQGVPPSRETPSRNAARADDHFAGRAFVLVFNGRASLDAFS
jgi:hypothetical protein